MIRSTRLLNYRFTNAQGVWFDNREDGMEQGEDTRVVVPADDHRAMGSPDEITVTIEPGDKLNNHPKGAL